MEARLGLRLLLYAAAFPVRIASALRYASDVGFRDDLRACLGVVDSSARVCSEFEFDVLLAAEDHRYMYHPGIDVIAIARATVRLVLRQGIEGASTIEQQFVRSVTERYERTARRKWREQLLAVSLLGRRSKRQIASAYLEIAHYGVSAPPAVGNGSPLETRLSPWDAISLIACLKYPRPAALSPDWHVRHTGRMNYIVQRLPSHTQKAVLGEQRVSPLSPNYHTRRASEAPPKSSRSLMAGLCRLE